MASQKCPLLEVDLQDGRLKKLRIGPSMGTTIVSLVGVATLAYLLATGIVHARDLAFVLKVPWR